MILFLLVLFLGCAESRKNYDLAKPLIAFHIDEKFIGVFLKNKKINKL